MTWPPDFTETRRLANVCGTLFWDGKEMKNSAAVPHVICRGEQLDLTDICGLPVNSICGLSQSFLGGLDRCPRDIQDGHKFASGPRPPQPRAASFSRL